MDNIADQIGEILTGNQLHFIVIMMDRVSGHAGAFVGPFNTRDEAQSHLDDLQEKFPALRESNTMITGVGQLVTADEFEKALSKQRDTVEARKRGPFHEGTETKN